VCSAKNIPPLEPPPYSLRVSLDCPLLMVFWQPHDLFSVVREGAQRYWDAAAKEIWRDDFEFGIKKGKQYKALRDRISSKIQSLTPQAYASALIPILDREIQNLSSLTVAESAKRSKDAKLPDRKNLEAICEGKMATSMGMFTLYFHLLLDAGFSPKIALLADRDSRLFRQELFNPWQFTDMMIAVEEPGLNRKFFDPTVRFGAPGLVLPSYQGVQGLMLDPKLGWTTAPFNMYIQPAESNQKNYEYILTVGEEEDRFQAGIHFTGYPEYAERQRYLASEPAEQRRSLKERFEKALPGASIEKADMFNVVNPDDRVYWNVEGVLEREGGAHREVKPFPGMQWPLYVPDSFPKQRELAIVMPYLQVHSAQSILKLPKGCGVAKAASFVRKNRFGQVSWTMTPHQDGAETNAIVDLRVEVSAMFAPPEAYQDLKDFLDWVSQACRRTLIIEKS